VSSEFAPTAGAASARDLQRLGVRSPYILFVGTLEPRKNVELLLDSYRDLVFGDGIAEHLVLAGKWGWGGRGLKRRLNSAELHSRVHRIGYVRQAVLPELYARASVFIYPSREEGFGLPPLEAMACGTPTVASDAPALAENLGGAAELPPVGDRVALAAAIRGVLRDERRRAQLRERGLARAARFRWEATAQATLACYADLAELGRRARSTGARERGRACRRRRSLSA
jgi:glycosyltransferase involved in cell wall biosynthesis